jgi:hypothetical protein
MNRLARLFLGLRILLAEVELTNAWNIHPETPLERARLDALREARARKLLALRQKRRERFGRPGQVEIFRRG